MKRRSFKINICLINSVNYLIKLRKGALFEALSRFSLSASFQAPCELFAGSLYQLFSNSFCKLIGSCSLLSHKNRYPLPFGSLGCCSLANIIDSTSFRHLWSCQFVCLKMISAAKSLSKRLRKSELPTRNAFNNIRMHLPGSSSTSLRKSVLRHSNNASRTQVNVRLKKLLRQLPKVNFLCVSTERYQCDSRWFLERFYGKTFTQNCSKSLTHPAASENESI